MKKFLISSLIAAGFASLTDSEVSSSMQSKDSSVDSKNSIQELVKRDLPTHWQLIALMPRIVRMHHTHLMRLIALMLPTVPMLVTLLINNKITSHKMMKLKLEI